MPLFQSAWLLQMVAVSPSSRGRPCAFVDVGLNDGESLTKWMHEALEVLPAGHPDLKFDPNGPNGSRTRGGVRWMNHWYGRLRLGLSRQDPGRAQNVTNALRACIDLSTSGSPSDLACYYGFEANPKFTHQLRMKQKSLRNGSACVDLHLQTAFADRDGAAAFEMRSQDTTSRCGAAAL